MPNPTLAAGVESFDPAILPHGARAHALERFAAMSSGRERPGRYWKIDLDALDLQTLQLEPAAAAPRIDAPARPGLFTGDLATALRERPELVARVFGRVVDGGERKYANLATAFANAGAFVHVCAGVSIDEPIVITYAAGEAALFAHTLVLLEDGASATVIERLEGTQPGAFVCMNAELLTGDGAYAVYASAQQLPADARVFFSRAAKPGAGATVEWAAAELGANLCAGTIDVAIERPGANVHVTALFFPNGEQHVDLVSTVSHDVGNARSQTLVKSAAAGRGQGRYLGNIRIAAHAQGSQAFLRDDALLLSAQAHIDSVPALEIAANDVKAYHGATVGALDEEQIFYMISRGITRSEAEKMIALGFFEPAIELFPTQALREELRRYLEGKIA